MFIRLPLRAELASSRTGAFYLVAGLPRRRHLAVVTFASYLAFGLRWVIAVLLLALPADTMVDLGFPLNSTAVRSNPKSLALRCYPLHFLHTLQIQS